MWCNGLAYYIWDVEERFKSDICYNFNDDV